MRTDLFCVHPDKSIMLGESFVFLSAEKPYIAPPIEIAVHKNATSLDNACPQLMALQRHFVEQLEGAEQDEKTTIKYDS